MKILTRYIASSIVRLIVVVFLVILAVEFFVSLVGEFGDMGNGNYGVFHAVIYVILSLPTNLYSLFPMIGLIGSIIGLGILSNNNELTVMRAAGMSVAEIIIAVLKTAFVVVIVVTFFGEVIAPAAQHTANTIKLVAESGGQAADTAQGIWVKSNDNFLHIDIVSKHYKLYGVTEYAFNNQHELISASRAKYAERLNHQWYLYDVEKSEVTPTGVSVDSIAKMPWNVDIDTHLLGISKDHSAEMTLPDLLRYIHYQNKNDVNAASLSLAFWQRVFQPFASLVMIFLAIPFVFGSFRRVTMGVRIVTGAVVGFMFYMLNQFFGPFSLVYQIPPVIGAAIPIVLFAFVAFLLMKKVR
jgi:lipopolysaccharide export system permease protein